ncbi:MAG: hypothetical protein MHM6MM_003350 [Cercozoa sp. M6MM]
MRLLGTLLSAISLCKAQLGERRAFFGAMDDSDLIFEGGDPTRAFRRENVNLGGTVHVEAVDDDYFDLTAWLDTSGLAQCSLDNPIVPPQCNTSDTSFVVIEQLHDAHDDDYDGIEWVSYQHDTLYLDGVHENYTVSLGRTCQRTTPLGGLVMHLHASHTPIDGEEFDKSEAYFRSECYGLRESVQRAMHIDAVGSDQTVTLIDYGLVSPVAHVDVAHSGYVVGKDSSILDFFVYYKPRDGDSNLPEKQRFQASVASETTDISTTVYDVKAPSQHTLEVSETQSIHLRVDFTCRKEGSFASTLKLSHMQNYDDLQLKLIKVCPASAVVKEPNPEPSTRFCGLFSCMQEQ